MWERSQAPDDGSPWIADVRSFDVPKTISGLIEAASEQKGCIAVTLSRRGGKAMIDMAQETAARCGIKIIWWNGPFDNLCGW